jgi:LPXTG-site transpeptidase (sortase) family protein
MSRRRIKTSQKKSPLRLGAFLGIFLLVLGAVLFAFPSLYKYLSRPQAPSQTTSKTGRNVTPSGNVGPIRIDPKLLEGRELTQPPLRVIIPSLSLDLSIIEAAVVNGYWELSETTASHGVGSANPGENGNIVVFAHARQGLFLPLRNIKTEDTIYLLTRDRWHRYEVREIKEVAPDQVEVIAPTPSETLTLYTCSGFLDSKRLIVTAKPNRP